MDTAFFQCVQCGSRQVTVAENWVCSQCGHVYSVQAEIPVLVRDWQQSEQMIEQARAVRPDWYEREQPPEAVNPWRHHLKKRREYVEATLRAHIGQQPVETLLDLGCGDGNHLVWLRNYTRQLYASDYNLLRLARARAAHPNATVFLADVLEYPAQDNFFDIIYFNHVIEHITEDEKALAQICRILKPGGLLVLGTPNEGAAWWQLAYRLQPRALQRSDHVQFYTAESLTQKMQRQGLVINAVKHLGWGPPHWSLDRRIRQYKIVDDVFEAAGRVILPRQASSLYVLATKK